MHNEMTQKILKYIVFGLMILAINACNIQPLVQKQENKAVPDAYTVDSTQDSTNSADIKWKDFFSDPYLIALIDTALSRNQELNIMLQEINISNNEVRARKGEYLPFVGLSGGSGLDKVGRYTRNGALEANNEIRPGQEFPEPLTDFIFGAQASWEVDIWKKLRNAKKSAVFEYLASVEGKNFMVTHLISEIADAYYELLALDNQLAVLKQNIQIQTNALEIVKLQKAAAKVTELAVRKFEAEVYKNRGRQFYIEQQMVETENRINFLMGRFPQPVQRSTSNIIDLKPLAISSGLPSQLLANRPDIRRAEMELEASKLNVKAVKAEFYPSLKITSNLGYQAFNPKFLLSTPESIIYGLAGELLAPLVNRNAIKAHFYTANSKQVQAAFEYEKTILNAYIEVANQLSKINNLEKSYDFMAKQVEALNQSISISNDLFASARADYMEILMTQRDALDAKFELIETKKMQLNARVSIYKALGGGWK
jgi:outer membrane protein, multidrug efflux system